MKFLGPTLSLSTDMLLKAPSLLSRLQDPLGNSKFNIICAYISIASHLRQPKVRKIYPDFTQPAKDDLELTVEVY